MRIVRCNHCDWIGTESDIIFEMSENGETKYCPYCYEEDALMDLTSESIFNDDQLEELWAVFEDIPMDPETEKIEDDFLNFPVGTHREEIWHWFDERYSKGVHTLMGV